MLCAQSLYPPSSFSLSLSPAAGWTRRPPCAPAARLACGGGGGGEGRVVGAGPSLDKKKKRGPRSSHRRRPPPRRCGCPHRWQPSPSSQLTGRRRERPSAWGGDGGGGEEGESEQRGLGGARPGEKSRLALNTLVSAPRVPAQGAQHCAPGQGGGGKWGRGGRSRKGEAREWGGSSRKKQKKTRRPPSLLFSVFFDRAPWPSPCAPKSSAPCARSVGKRERRGGGGGSHTRRFFG